MIYLPLRFFFSCVSVIGISILWACSFVDSKAHSKVCDLIAEHNCLLWVREEGRIVQLLLWSYLLIELLGVPKMLLEKCRAMYGLWMPPSLCVAQRSPTQVPPWYPENEHGHANVKWSFSPSWEKEAWEKEILPLGKCCLIAIPCFSYCFLNMFY